METVSVNTGSEYCVKIGAGLLRQLGQQAALVTEVGTAVLVSDSHVHPLYGEIAENSLKIAGFEVKSFVFAAGEGSKNTDTYLSLMNFLAEEHITRSDCLIALGGGVVGDLTGFAAATYLRGIPYLQVPTTLLSAVDASVGGKTGIDMPAGKNLIGAFYQPLLVLCDIDTLASLPMEALREGCAEIVKYGVLYDSTLLLQLSKDGINFDRERVIAQCVRWKAAAVSEDERDKGGRRLLNLGHTIGHSIEATSQYTVSHGCAVAIGMCIITKCAVGIGLCQPEVYDEIRNVLTALGLPTSTDYAPDALLHYMLSDKKRQGETLSLVLPATVGCCHIHPIAVDQLPEFLKKGM